MLNKDELVLELKSCSLAAHVVTLAAVWQLSSQVRSHLSMRH